jgi:hypothetical protein
MDVSNMRQDHEKLLNQYDLRSRRRWKSHRTDARSTHAEADLATANAKAPHYADPLKAWAICSPVKISRRRRWPSMAKR